MRGDEKGLEPAGPDERAREAQELRDRSDDHTPALDLTPGEVAYECWEGNTAGEVEHYYRTSHGRRLPIPPQHG